MIMLQKFEDPKQLPLAQEILAENQRYRELRNVITSAFQHPDPNDETVETLAELLEEFRDELAMHFALENLVPPTEEIVEQAPRLASQVRRLQEEQDVLYLESCDLAESMDRICVRMFNSSNEFSRIPRSLKNRWRKFTERLNEHDAAERELIYDTWFVDIGVGD